MGNQQERATIDLVINGKQSETSLKNIATAAVNARKELSKMAETDPGYKKQKKELEALMLAQQQRIVRINQEKTAWEKFKSIGGGVMAGVVGGNVITNGIQKVLELGPKLIDTYRQFNSASADMSANLNLNGKDMEYLSSQAIKMGPAMGKSAAEMAEGFKLVGSANSDLVETPELLADVTKQAVVLSQASKMTLADATASLVGSMNQFDAGADQSQRFINVMAGGAQVGSAEIGDMAMSLKASGIVAHQAGLSFEETNGALQSLSKESLKGEQAGTMLRNILLSLQTGADETNPKVVGLDKALDNLAKQNLSTAEMTKLFGKENITAALSLINHRDRVSEFTRGLTDTSAAYDMAAKNNATLDHQTAMFSARVEGLALRLATKLVPAYTQVVGLGNKLIDVLPEVGEWFSKNGEWLLIAGVPSLIAYNKAMIMATASAAANTVAEGYRRVAYQAGFTWLVISETATKAYALATGVLTGQITLQTAVVTVARNVWAAFSAVLLLNPFGLVAVGLTAVVSGLKYFSEHTERALKAERMMNTLRNQSKIATELSHRAQQDLNEKIARYNDLSVDEQANLKKTIALKQVEANARLANVYARAREIARSQAEPTVWQKAKVKVANTFSSTDELKQALKQQAEDNKAEAYAGAKEAGGAADLIAEKEFYKKMLADLDRIDLDRKNGKKGNGGTGSGQSDDEKKKAEKIKEANAEAILAVQKLKSQAVADDKARELAQAEFEAAQERKRLKESKAGIQEKTEWEKAIAEKLATDKKAIEDKYTLQLKEAQEKRLNALREAAEQELELKKKMKEAEITMAVANGELSKEEGEKAKLNAEEAFLEAKKVLNEAHYQSLIDLYKDFSDKKDKLEQDKKVSSDKTQGEMADNEAAQATAKKAIIDEDVKKTEESEEAKKKAAKDAFNAKKKIFDDSVTVLKTFFKENTIAYKAAFIAQQAWALGEVAINYSRAVIASIASASGVPFPGNILAIAKSIAIPTLEAASAVANIRAQKFDMPAFAEGGFTSTDKKPSGFTSGPTYFRKRNFLAGEEGMEWIMNGEMLKNPVMLDVARTLQGLQQSGEYRNLNYSTRPPVRANLKGAMKALQMSGRYGAYADPDYAGGSAQGRKQAGDQSSSGDPVQLAILQELQIHRSELQQNRAMLQDFAQRPISFDFLAYKQLEENVAQIKAENRL